PNFGTIKLKGQDFFENLPFCLIVFLKNLKISVKSWSSDQGYAFTLDLKIQIFYYFDGKI
ncbi:MAG: hypothetical protein MRZ23_01115, partial [Finegoldia magna]|nr:hypothetical protein [Finegoldia magna]